VELAKVIQDLRTELECAITTAKDATLRFELGPIELELSVAIETGGQAGAKARFLVAELGTQANADRTATQQITLTLTPRLGTTGISPLVSGLVGERER